jgi:hypothetical protein
VLFSSSALPTSPRFTTRAEIAEQALTPQEQSPGLFFSDTRYTRARGCDWAIERIGGNSRRTKGQPWASSQSRKKMAGQLCIATALDNLHGTAMAALQGQCLQSEAPGDYRQHRPYIPHTQGQAPLGTDAKPTRSCRYRPVPWLHAAWSIDCS